MVIELGCGRPLGVGEASLAEEPLSMWLIVDGEGLARYLVVISHRNHHQMCQVFSKWKHLYFYFF